MSSLDYVPSRSKLLTGLKDFLQTVTGRPFGISKSPQTQDSDRPPLPIGILIPRYRGIYSGPKFHSPFADGKFPIRIRSVGERDDQAEWLADQVRRAILGRDQNGRLLYEIPLEGMVVIDRSPQDESPGNLDQEGKLWWADDSFFITVTTDIR